MRRITFDSHGETLVGELHLPPSVSAVSPARAIVVAGAWFTVKEQMPSRYAAELAERGLVTLAFDFRGFGESGGAIRQRETPADKIADMAAAAHWLAGQPEVTGKVGLLGVCAGAGYAVGAADAPEVGAVAVVAPWLHDKGLVEAVYGGSDGVAALNKVAADARAQLAATGQQPFVPAASTSDRRAVMFGAPYYTEPQRGQIPAWRNEIDPGFWPDWLGFDAQAFATKLNRPFAMVESDAAALPAGARAFYAATSAPKTELWLDGVSQFDFYDADAPVKAAADFVAAHFRTRL